METQDNILVSQVMEYPQSVVGRKLPGTSVASPVILCEGLHIRTLVRYTFSGSWQGTALNTLNGQARILARTE